MRATDAVSQAGLFEEAPPPVVRREVPVVGEQKDIRYFAAAPKSVLNNPAATGMGFWSINPYVGCAFGCAYCYARYAHRYTAERLADAARLDGGDALATDNLPPWLAFERRIMVKREAPALLRKALGRPSILNALHQERVVIGTATDPYQPAERRFRVTRGILEVLAEQRGIGVTIISKSPLVTRDIDLLTKINERSRLAVHVSLITVDRELARTLEPRAPTPEARLRGIARLRANGIETGVNVMPVLPGITDSPDMVEELIIAVKKADASYIAACALRLQSSARDRYLPFIATNFPELATRYQRAYASSYQVNEHYREGLKERFTRVCAQYDMPFGRYNRGEVDEEEDVVAVAADQLDLLG
ncbi:MAG: radical SAM protein [Gemmatimonadaceae bacterium]